MASVREFLTARSGVRGRGVVTIGDRQIQVQALSFREKSEIHLMWTDDKGKDTREDAHQMRQGLFASRSILEDGGAKRAFTDDEVDLKILIELMGSDMDVFNAEIRRLTFADEAAIVKNLPPAKTNG